MKFMSVKKLKKLNNPITCIIGGRHQGKDIFHRYMRAIEELQKENEQLKEKFDITKKAFWNMAKQLLSVYDDEGCSYGDYIAGSADNPEQAVENYIKHEMEEQKND